MERRRVLAGIAGASTFAVAGCLGGSNTPDDAVEDLPNPTLGDDTASVTVDVWEDFSCPHCATFDANVYPRLVDEYVESGDIRYVFNDFPIPVHRRWSWDVAQAARAVQDRVGEYAFWEFKDTMFRNQDAYSETFISETATALDVDGGDLIADVNADRYRPVVENSRSRGDENGVRGTPTVFVDGESVPASYDAIASAIDARL